MIPDISEDEVDIFMMKMLIDTERLVNPTTIFGNR